MTKKKRTAMAVMAAVLAALMVIPTIVMIIQAVTAGAVSRSEIDSLEEQKTAIATERAAVQAQVNDLEAKQATVLEQKAALDRQNELARQEIEIITEEIDLYTKLVALKEDELKAAESVQEEQASHFRNRVRAMEENGPLSYVNILFTATSFSDFLSRIDFINEIMQYDSQLERNYIAATENVAELKADFEGVKAEAEIKKTELLDKKAGLEREIEAAFTMIREIESDIETYRAEIEANEAAELEVQAEIDAMVAELARLEAEAKKAAEQSGSTWNAAAAVGSTGSYIWPLPSNTYVSSGFGNRLHPIFQEYRFHAGIDVGGTAGSAIVAIDGGVVTVASPSPSYGNYVVIDHGNGNSSLYAHMTNYIVSVGQKVSQGETIGYVGSTGWSTGPHLHFEIRAGGTLVDPLGYYTNYTRGF